MLHRNHKLTVPLAVLAVVVQFIIPRAALAQTFYGSFPYGAGYEGQYSFSGSSLQTSQSLGNPQGLALDGNGNLYVANNLSFAGEPTTSVLVFAGGVLTGSPVYLLPLASQSDAFSAASVAVDSANSIYALTNIGAFTTDATYPTSTVITKYAGVSSTPTVLVTLQTQGAGGTWSGILASNSPYDRLAVSRVTGNIFLSDFSGGQVFEFLPTGSLLRTFSIPGLGGPITINSAGYLFAVVSNTVQMINTTTGVASTVLTLPTTGATPALTLDRNDNLYAAYRGLVGDNYYSAITELTAAGVEIDSIFYTTGQPISNNPPTDIAVDAPGAPAVRPVVTGTQGLSGWYVSAVTLEWAVLGSPTPTTSGCATVSVPNTKDKTYKCTATNALGSATDSVTIKVDTAKPAILLSEPTNNAIYPLNQSVLAAYTCSDATSGVVSCVGTVANGTPIDTSVGKHTFSVTATDNAGNTVTKTVNYQSGGATKTPVFSLAAGTYTGAQTVTVTDATPGAVIHYTTNGTTPTNSSSVYAGPITVGVTETLKADAIAPGFTRSAVRSASYTIQ